MPARILLPSLGVGEAILGGLDGVPTNVAADTLALERIDAISSIERLHTGHPYGLERRRRETL